ncbi:hypothetical protein BJV78DRAFT_160037 [Lactifluus subvellereus]|nr:hypothetical protein BJV78DRAFT_160037 [Lactifluus subvellereus]
MFNTLSIRIGWHRPNVSVNTVSCCPCVLKYADTLEGEMMRSGGDFSSSIANVSPDLLEKRSSIYSSRPHYISAGEYMSEGLSFAFTPNNDLYVPSFPSHIMLTLLQIAPFPARFTRDSKSMGPSFYPIQNQEAVILALALVKCPSDVVKHLQRHASSIMLSVMYHFPPLESENDPVVVRIRQHIERWIRKLQPGARLVEFLPWLRYVPSRFAKWKRDAQYWFIQDSLMFER